MRILRTILLVVTITATGCTSPTKGKGVTRVELIRKGQGKMLLSITRREWEGVAGPHGFVGYSTVGYWTALDGAGPTFENPHFQDNPSDFRCVGSVTLDMVNRRVRIEMKRIVSKPGEVERLRPHPVNGIYSIDAVRDAKLEEQWF
jgi:hypothetical protein